MTEKNDSKDYHMPQLQETQHEDAIREMQQQLSEAYTQLKKSNDELKIALKRLQGEKDILDRLCMDFTSVYAVDLNTGKYETLKLAETTNAMGMLQREQTGFTHFNAYSDQYAEKYLTEENRGAFKNWFSCANLKKQLEDSDRTVFHYESIPNAAGQRYFEAQVIKVHQQEEPSECKALIGLRYIDDVIEKEKNIQQSIQAALDETQIKNEIISAIGKSYFYITRIDIDADRYEVVSGYENFPKNMEKGGCYSPNTRRNCEQIVDDEYLEDFLVFSDISTLAERLQSEESISMEYRIKSGDWHRARLIVKKRDEQGRVTNVLCAIRNVSDEKRKEVQLKLKAAEANREAREKTRFLSNMSHDIRTPMNGIVGLINMADQHPEDMELQTKCRIKIKELSGYLVSLVNDVLDINKIQTDDFKVNTVTFDIANMLREVNTDAAVKAARKNIDYVIDWDNSRMDHRYLVGNPVYVSRILSILSDNAIKFSHSGTTITVGCSAGRSDEKTIMYTFFCKDQGIGMSKEFVSRAFDMFSQEDEGSRTRYEGTGLGLAIAKKLAERMHGTIRLESEKGVGTTAYVELPFLIGDPDELPVVKDSKAVSLQGRRALVVEDNALNMEIATFILEDQGMLVEGAVNGLEGVRRFKESAPGYYDVILMDVMMPELNGLDATRRIRAMQRQDAREIPIIAMSANALADDTIKSWLAGMNEHLTKPLDSRKIMDAIRKCL